MEPEISNLHYVTLHLLKEHAHTHVEQTHHTNTAESRNTLLRVERTDYFALREQHCSQVLGKEIWKPLYKYVYWTSC